ncbi:uncharacterized protein LOC116406899 isoform X2 [Xenopus tropicalis]|uniref:Uncharacterized protein LOC116406899 isoform X2 n=1 Tax=Xenopus tropicalis TaxID=8364 RepID=A0A8J1IQF5_XENTR|nr:uncharacterized protein LOC116406899 isoform X2 [Xenopus tropicalis]
MPRSLIILLIFAAGSSASSGPNQHGSCKVCSDLIRQHQCTWRCGVEQLETRNGKLASGYKHKAEVNNSCLHLKFQPNCTSFTLGCMQDGRKVPGNATVRCDVFPTIPAPPQTSTDGNRNTPDPNVTPSGTTSDLKVTPSGTTTDPKMTTNGTTSDFNKNTILYIGIGGVVIFVGVGAIVWKFRDYIRERCSCLSAGANYEHSAQYKAVRVRVNGDGGTSSSENPTIPSNPNLQDQRNDLLPSGNQDAVVVIVPNGDTENPNGTSADPA